MRRAPVPWRGSPSSHATPFRQASAYADDAKKQVAAAAEAADSDFVSRLDTDDNLKLSVF